jgi:hypothetical protein
MAGDARQSGTINPAAVESTMHGRFVCPPAALDSKCGLYQLWNLLGAESKLFTPYRPGSENDDNKVNDPTPRAVQDFRFTPSLMDPNSFQFMALANQPPGYYTPTPGGMTTIYHHQAGDLHTPTLGYNLVTPISIPNSLSEGLPVDPNADMNMHGFHHPTQFMPQHFQNINPFSQQAGYAPSTFLHRDSGYDPMDRSEESPMDHMTMQGTQPLNLMTTGFSEQMEVSSMTDGEK